MTKKNDKAPLSSTTTTPRLAPTVDALSRDQVVAAVAKLKAKKAHAHAVAKARREALTDEQRETQRAKSKAQREQKRADLVALLAKAKSMGIDTEGA